MELRGKISGEVIKKVMKGTVIMTRHPDRQLSLMSEDAFYQLLEWVSEQKNGLPEHRILRFFVRDAVELDLESEYIYIPSELLCWMEAEHADIVYFVKSQKPQWGEYLLCKESTDGTGIPIIIEELEWEDEEDEYE